MRLLLIIALSFIWINSNAQLLKTKLEITVLNTTGNPEAGAEVMLYASEDDYLAGKNAIEGKKFTDSNGEVMYKDLAAKSYYIQAQKGKADNYGESEKTIPLEAGRKNKVTVIITEGN
ncbi:MAG: carboxypeptidase-like regulatory domain-containing protein [Cytophagales bacterium]